MLSRNHGIFLAATLVTAGVLAGPSGRARAAFDNLYTQGHADIQVGYDSANRSLNLGYELASNVFLNGQRIGTTGAGDYGADYLTVVVGSNALETGASGLPSPFAGNPLYVLPQTSTDGRPFVGFGAEGIDGGILLGESLTLSLTRLAAAPAGGAFVLYQLGRLANPFMNTADGINDSDSISVETGGHEHYAFGFTQAGIYDMEFTATGTLLDGSTVTGTGTFRFQVGPQATGAVPEPGSLALMGVGLGSIALVRARRRSTSAGR